MSIRFDFLTDDVGNDFFMSGTIAKFAVVPISNAKEFFSV